MDSVFKLHYSKFQIFSFDINFISNVSAFLPPFFKVIGFPDELMSTGNQATQ